MRRTFILAAIGACVCLAGAAQACEVVAAFDDEAVVGDAKYDDLSAFNRGFSMALAEPTPDVIRFLDYVQTTYLAPTGGHIIRLRSADLAKLIGFAIGEAAITPAPVDVFASGFKAELERWVGRLGVYGNPIFMGAGPAEANQLWRLVEEGAYGFYDEEMGAAYSSIADSAGPTSIVAWFDGLRGVEKEQFLARAAAAGVAKNGGGAYTVEEFNSVSILMDGELDRRDYPSDVRRRLVRNLAAGAPIALSTE